MKTIKNRAWNVLVLLFLIILVSCDSMKTKDKMESDLYRIFPKGTYFDNALGVAKEKGYQEVKTSQDAGFFKQEGSSKGHEVGRKSIRFIVGEHKEGIVVSTSFEANLGFDEDGRLIEIWVRQTRDAP